MSSTIKQAQGPSVGAALTVTSIPYPAVKPGHVAIRVRAAAVNPIDWKQRDYGFMVGSWPASFGQDVAGVIEALGEGVTGLAVGDEVLAKPSNDGFSEISIVSADTVAKKPASWSWEHAASIPLGYLTAAAGVHTGLGLALPFVPGTDASSGPAPKSVLVLGGSSSVGATAIQLLRLALPAGTSIFATSSASHAAHLKSLGADAVFDRSSAQLIEEIRAAAPGGAGVDAILDAVGAATQTELFDTLRKDGLRVYGEIATGAEMQKPADIKATTVFAAQLLQRPGGSNLFPALSTLLAEDKLKLPIPVKVVGESLDDASTALDALKAGVSGTKLVVRV